MRITFGSTYRFCSQKWNGSSLVLGTMYAYDIFAAMPCCPERLTVSRNAIHKKKYFLCSLY